MRNYTDLFNQLQNTGGFTCGWNGLNDISQRYIVGITDNLADSPSNAKELKTLLISVLEQKQYKKYIGNPLYCFGVWHSPVTKNHVSVDINLCTNDLNTALTTGFDTNQDCIYDQEAKMLIWLPKWQQTGTETQKSDYRTKVRQFLNEGKYITEFNDNKLSILPIWQN